MYARIKPEVVVHLAGLIGGIMANKLRPADYNYQNLLMGTMILHEAYVAGVKKYVTLMGGCSYPAHAPNPIKESELWNGYPQEESAPYSLAKAIGSVQAAAYRKQYNFNALVLVPGNLYGPYDNFDLQNSHVIPALIRKYHEAALSGAQEIVAWGTGKPVRDFIYIEDACHAIISATENYDSSEIVNISSGNPTTIKELVETTARIVGFKGTIRWDHAKPDGQMLKAFDVSRMKAGLEFSPKVTLSEGLSRTYDWYRQNS
jgi:GDP-L-fucose synthase